MPAGFGFSLVYEAVRARGSMDVTLPHGPDFFQFGSPERMQAALAEAGFAGVAAHSFEQSWHVADADRYVEAILAGTVRARAVLAAQSDAAADGGAALTSAGFSGALPSARRRIDRADAGDNRQWRAVRLNREPTGRCPRGAQRFCVAALGDPLNVLLWLANQQSAEGRGLKSGEVVSTGTCTGLDPVPPVIAFKPILATSAPLRFLSSDQTPALNAA